MAYILSHGTQENKETVMITSDISFINAEIKARFHDKGVTHYREYQQEEGITVIDYGELTCYFIEETGISLATETSSTLDYKTQSVRKQDIFKAIARDILMIDGIDHVELRNQFIKVLLFTSEDGEGRNFPILIFENSNGIEVSYHTHEDEFRHFDLDLSTFEDIVYYMKEMQEIIDFHTEKI